MDQAFVVSYGAPSAPLAGVIRAYWEVRGSLAHERERVLPREDVLLIANLGAPQVMFDQAGRRTVLDGAWFVGLQAAPLVTAAMGLNWLCGVRFSSEGAFSLFGPVAGTFADAVVPVEDVFPQWRGGILSALRLARSPRARFAAFDHWFGSLLGESDPRTKALAWATARLRSDPHLRVDILAADIGWSRQRFHG